MLKSNLYDHTGKILKEVTLPEDLFNVSVKPELMTQALHVYRANSHQGTSKVQTRGDVDRTKAKWFKQKGTGRARHGARSAPIFVGGGQAHGPHGIRAKNLKLNEKMKRLSVLGSLSTLAANGSISLITDLDKFEPKTKNLLDLLKKMDSRKKATFLVTASHTNLKLASKNVDVSLVPFSQINAYMLLNSKKLIIDADALDSLRTWLIPTTQVVKEAPKKATTTTKKTELKVTKKAVVAKPAKAVKKNH